jgi:hypothetical protein
MECERHTKLCNCFGSVRSTWTVQFLSLTSEIQQISTAVLASVYLPEHGTSKHPCALTGPFTALVSPTYSRTLSIVSTPEMVAPLPCAYTLAREHGDQSVAHKCHLPEFLTDLCHVLEATYGV